MRPAFRPASPTDRATGSTQGKAAGTGQKKEPANGKRARRRATKGGGGVASGNRPMKIRRAAGGRAAGGKRPGGKRAGRRVNDGGKRRKGAAPVKKARRAPASCLPANAPREGGQGNGAREKGPVYAPRGKGRLGSPRGSPAYARAQTRQCIPNSRRQTSPTLCLRKKGPLAGPLSQAADASADAAPQGHTGHAQRKQRQGRRLRGRLVIAGQPRRIKELNRLGNVSRLRDGNSML